MNYEKDMRIDETSLDIEWLEQAELAMKYGKYYAEAKQELTEAEEKVKVIRSELVKEANENPDMYLGKGIKPTGPNIEAYYRTHKRHKDIKQEIIALQFELDITEIAKNEISFTRKAALENLVTLHGQQYFAGPKVPRAITSEREKHEQQKKVDSGIGKRLNRTRTK